MDVKLPSSFCVIQPDTPCGEGDLGLDSALKKMEPQGFRSWFFSDHRFISLIISLGIMKTKVMF